MIDCTFIHYITLVILDHGGVNSYNNDVLPVMWCCVAVHVSPTDVKMHTIVIS